MRNSGLARWDREITPKGYWNPAPMTAPVIKLCVGEMMGRQIQIAATLQDEHDFLGFVRKTADVAVFGVFTQSKEDLWVGTFHPDLVDHSSYSIWNRGFPWTPEYGQTKAKGLFYISN